MLPKESEPQALTGKLPVATAGCDGDSSTSPSKQLLFKPPAIWVHPLLADLVSSSHPLKTKALT